METEVKLTKLAQCAGCGAKVGAGTLAKLLDGIQTRSDERLLVGFDKSDDASVYKIDDNTALHHYTHRRLAFFYALLRFVIALSELQGYSHQSVIQLKHVCRYNIFVS